jgi:hypothetical protein
MAVGAAATTLESVAAVFPLVAQDSNDGLDATRDMMVNVTGIQCSNKGLVTKVLENVLLESRVVRGPAGPKRPRHDTPAGLAVLDSEVM